MARMKCRVLILGCLFLLLGVLASAQTYKITDLGVLPGDTSSLSSWVNSVGQVVGCSDTSSGSAFPCQGTNTGHAFLWTSASGLQDLGTLPGGTFSTADGINDSGQAVGWSTTNGQNVPHGFRWTQAQGMTDLGTLSGGTYSYAIAITKNGVICGYSDSGSSNGVGDAVVWTPANKIMDLGSLPGGPLFNEALTINDHYQIAGAALYQSGNFQAFYWTPSSSLKPLPTFPGATNSAAGGNNLAGVIVGSSNSGTNSNGIAVAWDTKLKIHTLGTLPGDASSFASYINDLDEAVGASANSSGTSRAVIWTKSGGIKDLNKLIPPNSGWNLIFAIQINNAGQITGYGTINGENHAFLLTP